MIKPELAKRIAEAKTSTSGNRIKDGDYLFVVKRNICDAKFNGVMFIPEFDVVECEKTQPDVAPNAVGSDCSCAWPLDAPGKGGEAARGNIKGYLCALLGLSEDEPLSSIMEKASNYSGPPGDPDNERARGMLILCSTRRQIIATGKNAGNEGVFPRFSKVDQTSEEVASRRKDLDARKR